jgi:hypothetical protein
MMITRILIAAMIVVSGAKGYAQQVEQTPAIKPPVHSVSTNGTLRIRLNDPVKDWLLGANVTPAGATATVQVFEIERDFKGAGAKRAGLGFAKSVSYPAVNVMAGTVQINGVGSRDTTTVYVEAPAWTILVVTGPNDEVLYQTPLTKTLLVSRGLELKGPPGKDFAMVLPWSDRTHEARFQIPPRAARSILQARK